MNAAMNATTPRTAMKSAMGRCCRCRRQGDVNATDIGVNKLSMAAGLARA
jgi:hypothetical protein